MLGNFLGIKEFSKKFQKVKGVTLLGVGPVTKNTIIAILQIASEYDFPVFLIASRNQVDKKEFGGGYLCGWDQKGFISGVEELIKTSSIFPKAIYFCRDHGGPWQRDKELNERIPHNYAIEIAKKSFLADLKAGFDLFHIDPTKNPFLKEEKEPLKIIINDTVELIAFIEEQRKKLNLPEVSYEVGTEDIKGGLTQPGYFSKFLTTLKKQLNERKLPLPDFIVGQTGTLVKFDTNTGFFNPDFAKELAKISYENGCFLKEHNADYLDEESLKMHPILGISAANVAPEFGVTEIKTILRLSYLVQEGEKFRSLLTKKVLSENKWQKWVPEHLKCISEDTFRKDPGIRNKVVTSCGHYYLEDPELKQNKDILFNAISIKTGIRPEREVIESIKRSIFKYICAFNLKDLNKKIPLE